MRAGTEILPRRKSLARPVEFETVAPGAPKGEQAPALFGRVDYIYLRADPDNDTVAVMATLPPGIAMRTFL
ncbi:MAG: hypothetical protein KJ645_10270 [Planctomycetes bacterium]|nr:hypothetical protein [Planctomycetota bacterium]